MPLFRVVILKQISKVEADGSSTKTEKQVFSGEAVALDGQGAAFIAGNKVEALAIDLSTATVSVVKLA